MWLGKNNASVREQDRNGLLSRLYETRGLLSAWLKQKKRRFVARNRSSATSPAEEQYGVLDIVWNALLVKLAPLKTRSPVCSAFAQETQSKMGPDPFKFLQRFAGKMWWGARKDFFTFHSWQNLRYLFVHSFKIAASLRAQPRQLHPCMQVWRQLNPFLNS